MLTAQRRGTRSQRAATASVPAPVGGWNARDSLAQMKPQDAVILDNYFPSPYDVFLRPGYTPWVTGITGTVETLATYSGATNKMFAVAGGKIYNATTAGAVGAAVVSGLTSNRFQKVNFGTPGGQFLYMVNGLDKPQLYDGTTWVSVDGASTPAITGVTTTLLENVNIFKTRLFFIEKGSMRAWYLPVNSIGGAAAALDFSSLFREGGYLVAMGTWSLDAGYGMDDYAIFMSSNGEILVYKGTDPSNAATWAMVGLFQVGSPIGKRCIVKYAGDALIISRDGLLPLSASLQSSRINTHQSLTDKIQWPIGTAINNYSANFGWETTIYPKENAVILNIPVSSTVSQQCVMNTITGAWCRFLGWNAATFELLNDALYFGGAGFVAKAWTGTSDAGSNIVGEALQSFSYFGDRGRLKKFNEARPLLSWDNQPGLLLGINTDFDVSPPTGLATGTGLPPAMWDAALWDSAVWAGDPTLRRTWQTVSGIGNCAALHILSSSNASQIRWAGTDYLLELGGTI